jgi:hypothetical protein
VLLRGPEGEEYIFRYLRVLFRAYLVLGIEPIGVGQKVFIGNPQKPYAHERRRQPQLPGAILAQPHLSCHIVGIDGTGGVGRVSISGAKLTDQPGASSALESSSAALRAVISDSGLDPFLQRSLMRPTASVMRVRGAEHQGVRIALNARVAQVGMIAAAVPVRGCT